ncbi:MAG: Fe(3+) ABC transporter substrate-binding protein [Parvularculaceae bacterium]|nr:Fe(3+) ABC transporter substrate-binding protein [Parvularculaceae bacterium]
MTQSNQIITGASAAILIMLASACGRGGAVETSEAARPANGEVNVYSARHYDSDLAIYDAFTAETGIRVNLIEAGGDALIERLSREAEASPADVFITADAGILWRAEDRGVLRPIEDPAILERVPAQFRDPENEWVALSKRARIIIYDKARGAPEGLSDYDDLASPKFAGEICVRSSTNVYNQSLLAGIIENEGAEKAEEWTKGVVANFARKPEGNDTSQIEAVAAGQCRISIVNSYYLARYVGSDNARMRAIGEKVGFIFPNQDTTGTHINISGVGVARYAPDPENAEKLIAFLLSDEAQEAFAAGNNEYPVVAGVKASGPISSFGEFRADTIDMSALGAHQTQAVKIFDRSGWR